MLQEIGIHEPGVLSAMQSTLAPEVCYRDARVEAYGRSLPREDVGGDLVDLVANGCDVTAYVADVCGHGLPSGVLMGMLKTAIRYGLQFGHSLQVLLDGLNQVLPAVKEPNMFATSAMLRFDGSNEAEYVTAGHVPLLQYRRRHRDIVRWSFDQFPLGLFEEASFVSSRIPYEDGDLFALATDGIVEAADPREVQFGLEGIESILCVHATCPLREIFDAVVAAAHRYGRQHDDQSLLLIRVSRGPAC